MPTREEMIAQLKRSDMIDQLKKADAQALTSFDYPKAPETDIPTELKGMAAGFAEFNPLQGVSDIGAGVAGATIGEAKELFGYEQAKSFPERYQEEIKGIQQKRKEDYEKSQYGKYAGAGLGIAGNVLLPMGGASTGALKEAGKNIALSGATEALRGGELDISKGGEAAAWTAGIEGALKGAGKVLKTFPNAVTGIGKDVAEYYTKNVKDVDAARPLGDVVDDFVTNIKNYRRKLSNESTAAYNALKESGKEIPASRLTSTISKQADRVGSATLTPQAKQLASEVSSFGNAIDEIAGPDGVIKPENVKDFIRQLDDQIDWEAISYNRATTRDRALKAIRDDFDSILKDKKNFPEYADIMEKISKKASTLEDLGAALKNEKAADRLFKRLAQNKDPRAAEALAALDQEMATNFSKEIKDAGIKDLFLKENSRGSRNTLVSGAVGAMAGSVLGVPPWISGAIGATAGPSIDKYGRQAYQTILRANANAPDIVKKYALVLNSAMQSGPASLAATHMLLRQKYKDYEEATKEK